MLMKLFNKLQSNLSEVKEYYDIDTEVKISCRNRVWNIGVNRVNFSGNNLEELLKETIGYFTIDNFRQMEEREWM